MFLPLPEPVQHATMRFLPEMIAENSLTAVKPVAYALSPWAGLGMLALYAAALLGAGAISLAKRDA